MWWALWIGTIQHMTFMHEGLKLLTMYPIGCAKDAGTCLKEGTGVNSSIFIKKSRVAFMVLFLVSSTIHMTKVPVIVASTFEILKLFLWLQKHAKIHLFYVVPNISTNRLVPACKYFLVCATNQAGLMGPECIIKKFLTSLDASNPDKDIWVH